MCVTYIWEEKTKEIPLFFLLPILEILLAKRDAAKVLGGGTCLIFSNLRPYKY